MKDMEENIDIVDEAVEKEATTVDNPVEEVKADVEEVVVATEAVEEIVDNKEVSVDNTEEVVEIPEENVENPVDNVEQTDVLLENVVNSEEVAVETVEETVETVDNSEEDAETPEEMEVAVCAECGEALGAEDAFCQSCGCKVETPEEPKKKAPWKAIIAIVILILAGIGAYFYCNQPEETHAILYAKDDALYVADGAAESLLLHEGMGADDGYHYYYGAWGALSAEESSLGYYIANVNEMGIGELYMQDLEKPAGETKIADNVFAFNLSDDGSTCVYIALKNDTNVVLFVAKDGVSQVVTESMLMQETAYKLSADGAYVLYQEDDGVDTSLLVMDVATGEKTVLAEQSIMFAIAEESGIAYQIAYENELSVLYEYVHGVGETKIAENIYFFDVMADGASILYATLDTEEISCGDLIDDDVTDLSGYDAARQATIASLREQMETAAGVDPILQDVFIWKDGASTPFERQIIALSPLTGEGNFFFGYGVPAFEKMPLSEINSLDEAIMMYYTELAYGEKEVFVANDAGDIYDLETEGAIPTTMLVSGDGTQVAYLLTTDIGNSLVLETLGVADSAVEVAMDVYSFAFSGENHSLVYYKNYVDGVGDLYAYENGASTLLDVSVLGVSYAEDDGAVTYLVNPDETGNGDMKVFDGVAATLVSENVFSFQCRDANSTVYMKDYDLTSGVGDIYHYFNGESLLIVEDATAIFMY